MARTCIVRGDPPGSGEHIFPACLRGHRVNNGIYSERHNNAYGPLAAMLSTQLAFFNARCGIRNTRTKQIQVVTLTDSARAKVATLGSRRSSRTPRNVMPRRRG
jgi:hypothetical protein